MAKNLSLLKKLGLNQIIGLMVAGLVLFSGLSISLLSFSSLNTQLQRGLQQELQQQLERLTLSLAPSLIRQDRLSLTVSLNEWLKSSPDLYQVRIYDTSRQLLAEAGQETKPVLLLDQPITQDNFALGSLQANASLARAHQIARHYLAFGLMLSLLCSLLAGLLGYLLADGLLAYFIQLQQALQQWQQDPSKSLKLPKAPVLGQLQPLNNSIYTLASRFQQQQDMDQAIQRFGAHSLKDQALSLKYHECGLLFIEVNNLEALQREISVEQLTLHLNRYYQVLLHACKLYQGRIERYAGNGVVLLFGLNNEQPAHAALHALYTAQLFMGYSQQQTFSPIKFSLAAHWGQVLLAPVSSPDQPFKHELVSDALHWASHLASRSQDSILLASQTLYEQLTTQTKLEWRSGETITDLHGNQQACWHLQSLGEKQQALIERQIKQITHLSDL